MGAYKVNIAIAVLATAGIVTATVYSLWMIHTTFFGLDNEGWKIPDFSLREMSAMAVMIISLVLLGLYPQPILNTAGQSLDNLQRIVEEHRASAVEGEVQTYLPVSDRRGNQ